MYKSVDPGVRVFRSRLQIGGSHSTTIDFGKAYPVLAKFVEPGDVLRISARVFARYQPTLAPIMNSCNIRYRFFYIDLRQVQNNIADIITGTHDGITLADVPSAKNFVDDVVTDANYVVSKGKFWDYIGIPCLDYKSIKSNLCLPAQYWYKAYMKIYWDYYRDENLFEETDFETWWTNTLCKLGGQSELFSVNLKKDYFTSATPFEMKGEIPTFDVETTEPFTPDTLIPDYFVAYDSDDNKVFSDYQYMNRPITRTSGTPNDAIQASGSIEAPSNAFYIEHGTGIDGNKIINGLNSNSLNNVYAGTAGYFNMRDIRAMGQLTRIKEREMRCGSRYTEYLRSNFHIAPADETLRRPVYLGGFKQPILTNEVQQTAADGSTPVGTMRGKGITDGGNTIKPYHAKEFGILFGLIDVVPDLIYTQGINRELTYKSRYDFFNPSFQNLSEQEVRNGEIYISTTDGKNDDTFGFQGMYNELRSKKNIVTADLRDTLKYWTQAIEFASRPNLNQSFVSAESYADSFKRPFAVSGADPIILHVENYVDAYRPMIREAIPGLVDHN